MFRVSGAAVWQQHVSGDVSRVIKHVDDVISGYDLDTDTESRSDTFVKHFLIFFLFKCLL